MWAVIKIHHASTSAAALSSLLGQHFAESAIDAAAAIAKSEKFRFRTDDEKRALAQQVVCSTRTAGDILVMYIQDSAEDFQCHVEPLAQANLRELLPICREMAERTVRLLGRRRIRCQLRDPVVRFYDREKEIGIVGHWVSIKGRVSTILRDVGLVHATVNLLAAAGFWLVKDGLTWQSALSAFLTWLGTVGIALVTVCVLAIRDRHIEYTEG